jgi:hypothetical protein
MVVFVPLQPYDGHGEHKVTKKVENPLPNLDRIPFFSLQKGFDNAFKQPLSCLQTGLWKGVSFQ